MDSNLYDGIRILSEKALLLMHNVWFFMLNDGYIHCFRLLRILHLLTPIVVVMAVYYYLKYLLIYNAYQYEEFVRRKYERIKKVNKHLKVLAKRYGNLYFCYMPMNHGTVLPRVYTLFLALKDVLTNTERSASRVLRMNLLVELLHASQNGNTGIVRPRELSEGGYFDVSSNDIDPLSEFNLDLMKCSRELIIQGVKDFDTMSTVYRVLETVVEDSH